MKDNVWLTYEEDDRKELEQLSDAYKAFLSQCKTERECTAFFEAEARKNGYRSLEELVEEGTSLKAGAIRCTPLAWARLSPCSRLAGSLSPMA